MSKKPLCRTQAYLIETKRCLTLLREVFIELEHLLVITTLILFFALGVYEALSRLLVQPRQPVGQTLSRPCDQDRK